jgi:exodeoxyribonuclease V gamma subunit
LLSEVSRRMETHLFVTSPSREYWAEIRSMKDQHRILSRSTDSDPELLHLEVGHPLLASLGRLGRDFQRSLEEVGYAEWDRDLYCEPSGAAGSLLNVLQEDILQLRHRGGAGGALESLPLPAGDESIRLHSCHSAMREVEVLRDELLACFEADPTLEPRDVIVMTPDIEAYTPFIEAVFDAGRRDPEALGRGEGEVPHRIADRGPDATSAVAEALRRCLDLLAGRFTAAEVSDLLGIEGIREKLELEAEDLEPLRAWIAESGIRWGVDAAHRGAVGQPERSENTWRFGIDRLLLGYASPDAQDDLFLGVRPLAGVEGRSAELLGRLLDLCERLLRHREVVQEQHSPSDWSDHLVRLLGELVARDDDNAHEHALVCRVLAEIAESAEQADFSGEIPLDVMREQIERGLQQARRPTRFLTGGVTFCQLVPMRSIPFRVVCLLGMNDESFPRIRRPLGFDLIARRPKPGDRSTRDDDRFLFLEALLSARERLVISYVGQSVRDGSALPPSVVVSELLDVLGESFHVPQSEGVDGRSAIRQALVIDHPLQPFSPRYFEGGSDARLYSYSAIALEAARRLLGDRCVRAPFLSAPLQEPGSTDDVAREVAMDGAGGEEETVDLEELVSFFRDPVKRFMQRSLLLYVSSEEDEIPDRESAELAGLERWSVGSDVLNRLLDGGTRDGAYRLLRAAGALPMGASGRIQFEGLASEAEAIARGVGEARQGESIATLQLDLEIDGTRIQGQLSGLWPGGRIAAGFSRLGRSAELGLWIRHLVLNLLPDAAGAACESFLFGREPTGDGASGVKLGPVEDSAEILSDLLEVYRLGQTQPLPLFESASRVYAQSLLDHDSKERARADAWKAYQGSDYRPGDAAKPYVAMAFGDAKLFAPEARTATGLSAPDLAASVWLPLLERLQEVS